MAKSKRQNKSLELSCRKERTMNHLERIQNKCLKEAQCSTKIADRQTNKVFKIKLDFLGSAVFKNMPPTAGDTGLVTDSGKFHLLQGN